MAFLLFFFSPVVRCDPFLRLLFCLSARIYVHISPRQGLGGVGVVLGGGWGVGEILLQGGLGRFVAFVSWLSFFFLVISCCFALEVLLHV